MMEWPRDGAPHCPLGIVPSIGRKEKTRILHRQAYEGWQEPLENECSVLSELVQLAYKSQPEVEPELPEYGCYGTDVAFFQTSLSNGLIIEFDDIVAVAFRDLLLGVNGETISDFRYDELHWKPLNSRRFLCPTSYLVRRSRVCRYRGNLLP